MFIGEQTVLNWLLVVTVTTMLVNLIKIAIWLLLLAKIENFGRSRALRQLTLEAFNRENEYKMIQFSFIPEKSH